MSRPRPTGISFAYPAVPSAERARLALNPSRLRGAYRLLANEGERTFLLSTCLRCEVSVPGDEDDLRRCLKLVFPDAGLPEGGVLREGEEQVRHLFRVAAGVESPVLGEPEVLGQFRQAVEVGREEGAMGGLFEQLLGEAINAGRAARRLLPGTPEGSLARVAAQLTGASSEVAVFGGGSMARAVVAALAELPAPQRVTVYARRPESVDLPGVEVRSLDEAPQALAHVPAAVSATSAKRMLFAPQVLTEALGGRREPLLLVDLAMPPDFDLSTGTMPLRYFGVDELADLARRARPSDDVDRFLEEEARAAAVRQANHRRAGPVISAILREADRAVEEEVERFSGRLEESDREVLEQLGRTVARRILHEPVSFLSRHRRGGESAEILAEAFGVEDEED